MRINEVVVDNHPSADTFRRGDILAICQEAEEVYKMCFLTNPTNLAVGGFPREDSKEVIGGGVRSNPLCTEKELIEFCDALGCSSKPTIGESGIGYAMSGALRLSFARSRSKDWRIMLAEMDSECIIAGRKIRGKEFAELSVCWCCHNKNRY